MKNPHPSPSIFSSFDNFPAAESDSSYKRVSCLTGRMTESFESEELHIEACDEIPDHALTTCLERCADIIGGGLINKQQSESIRLCIRENLHGLAQLRQDYGAAESEYQSLKAKSEPFFEKMAPLLDEDDKALGSFEGICLPSLKQTLAECVEALTFAKYRRDNLRERMVALISYVGEEIVESVRARNLANPYLLQIEGEVKRALYDWE